VITQDMRSTKLLPPLSSIGLSTEPVVAVMYNTIIHTIQM